MPIAPLSLACGAAAWSLAEYALHRFVGHGPRRAPPEGWRRFVSPSTFLAEFNREHIAHHVDPTYFAPASRKAAAAIAALGAIGTVGAWLVGRRRARSFALGFAATYVVYEVLHRRVHTHGPTGPYARWRRKHHLYHHHGRPKLDHGVTSPFWDRAFGTEHRPARVRVPRRMAPAWLVGEDGGVREELREDYEIVDRASAVVDAT
jgi:hypothetical protein